MLPEDEWAAVFTPPSAKTLIDNARRVTGSPALALVFPAMTTRRGFGFNVRFPIAWILRPIRTSGFDVRANEQEELELLKDGVRLLSSFDSGDIAGALFQAILEAIHPGIEWLGLMHGAAVARDGEAILLPGSSGAGKSTLAAFLAAHGYDYISDDLIALRNDGKVMPWPTPFSIKRGSWPVIAPLYSQFDDLDEVELLNRRIKFLPVGNDPWTKPPQPVRAIIFPQYSKDFVAAVEPISPLHALARLVEERLWLGYPITEQRLRSFLGWFEKIPAYLLPFSDLSAAERQIWETLGLQSEPNCAHVVSIDESLQNL